MYKIVLIRHGESTWNKENRFSGWTDVDLSEKGVAEAKEAGREIKADAKDKKTEVLEIRCTASYFFFAPADKKEPYPALTWKLTGRKSKSPKLKAKLWYFEGEKKGWALVEMEFDKAEQ